MVAYFVISLSRIILFSSSTTVGETNTACQLIFENAWLGLGAEGRMDGEEKGVDELHD